MKTFVAGTDVTLSVVFTRDGKPAIPEPETASWRLLASDGNFLAEGSIESAPTDFTYRVTIYQGLNTVNGSFSKRTLVAQATSNGRPVEYRETYRIIPGIPFTVTPADVRSYIGVNDRELPDADIDLVKSFLELQADIGTEIFAGALSSGERAELKANDAILYKTVLALIPSLPNRVANKETDGQLSFQRNTQKDFSALAATTNALLASALSILITRNEVGYALLITTNDADPVTG